MSATVEHEQDRLERIEVELADLKNAVATELARAATADEVDPSFAERLRSTLDRMVNLDRELQPEDFDPRALADFRGVLIDAVRVVRESEQTRPLDTVDALLVHAEQLRHIVRDAIDGHVEGTTAAEVLAEIKDSIPDARLRDLAALLDRSERQIQRWSQSRSPAPRRMRIVARLVALLRHGWTAPGIVAWFHRPRPELGGSAPAELLDDPSWEAELLAAARRGRAQHGS
jgi:hypothetical protein